MSRSARENIFDRQLKLQIEAGKLLDRTSLIEKLEDFGTVHLVGSTALGMLTQRDLDYDVVTKNRINFNSVLSLADELTRQHSLPEVIVRDNHINDNESLNPRAVLRSGFGIIEFEQVPLWERLPSGIFMKILAEFQEGDEPYRLWRLDICFLQQDQQRSLGHRDELARQLTDRDRGRIMQIKERVARSPEYHRTFSGPDIYDAVLTHKVRDVQGFFNYLAAR
ncbi:MAG TPA: hypothetical protein VJG66_01065 [Patescibacteria group bacterium]|nr:hypothetical protein [Patescibacteria group bacterium]